MQRFFTRETTVAEKLLRSFGRRNGSSSGQEVRDEFVEPFEVDGLGDEGVAACGEGARAQVGSVAVTAREPSLWFGVARMRSPREPSRPGGSVHQDLGSLAAPACSPSGFDDVGTVVFEREPHCEARVS